jgi:hypothetical protein
LNITKKKEHGAITVNDCNSEQTVFSFCVVIAMTKDPSHFLLQQKVKLPIDKVVQSFILKFMGQLFWNQQEEGL